jgi:hypothetical protein
MGFPPTSFPDDREDSEVTSSDYNNSNSGQGVVKCTKPPGTRCASDFFRVRRLECTAHKAPQCPVSHSPTLAQTFAVYNDELRCWPWVSWRGFLIPASTQKSVGLGSCKPHDSVHKICGWSVDNLVNPRRVFRVVARPSRLLKIWARKSMRFPALCFACDRHHWSPQDRGHRGKP